MTERHRDTLEFFVCPGCGGGGDGTLDRPFGSLEAALESLRDRGAELRDASGALRASSIEIVCVERPAVAFRLGERPQYRFYLDASAAADGDGTELAPWSSLGVAIQGLLTRRRDGRLSWRLRDRLRLENRVAFTATSLERWKARKERLARYLFQSMAWLLVLPVLLILGYLLVHAWPVLTFSFLFTNPQDYMTAGGIWAPLIGTFCLVLVSLLIAAPIGVLAGVYLNEYAGDNWATRVINLAVVNLAGVPSIVHALFGVGAFVHFAHMNRSLLAASCTVAVMTLPVIITSSREALAAVPMSFREACWNMGASRWQTIRTIVLPNSISGILTGVILQVSRAAGETAPILLTGAVFFVPVQDSGVGAWLPYGLHDRFMALSMHLYTLALQVKGVPEPIQYGTAVVLIALVLVVNSLSIGLRLYLRTRKRW
jgi:phosphate transport system permease protein